MRRTRLMPWLVIADDAEGAAEMRGNAA